MTNLFRRNARLPQFLGGEKSNGFDAFPQVVPESVQSLAPGKRPAMPTMATLAIPSLLAGSLIGGPPSALSGCAADSLPASAGRPDCECVRAPRQHLHRSSGDRRGFHARILEELHDRQFPFQVLLKSRLDLHQQQRMPSEVKEIVVDTDLFETAALLSR